MCISFTPICLLFQWRTRIFRFALYALYFSGRDRAEIEITFSSYHDEWWAGFRIRL